MLFIEYSIYSLLHTPAWATSEEEGGFEARQLPLRYCIIHHRYTMLEFTMQTAIL